MTAQNMVDNVTSSIPNLVTTSAKMLRYLNLAKNQLATDTLLWLNGETIAMTTSNEYTLTVVPLQIIDVYDDSLNLRPRNSTHRLGYYQLSPSTIYVNNPDNGVNLNINYYYAPTDYILADVLDIPPSLISAMEAYIKYCAYDEYSSEKEQTLAQKFLSIYENDKDKFLSKTDNGNLDTISYVNPIEQKGLV